MAISDPSPLQFWHLLTRLGEAQILLPAALLALVTMLRHPDSRSLAAWWMALLGLAAFVTTASKVAFIGWGIGWPELNFTGISGHAMFAAAVFPLLLGTLASSAPRAGRHLAIVVGCALAALVGASRVVVGAHSVSEVLAGLLVGGAASAASLALARLPNRLISPVIPAVVALWLALVPLKAPASRSHSLVTKVALTLSGHERPYTRNAMLRELRRRERAPAACAPQPIHLAGSERVMPNAGM
jgi:membrane-associated phospholipid phosphatase